MSFEWNETIQKMNNLEESDAAGVAELDALLSRIPELPQRQDSFANQIADLYQVANRLGMYDAADGIKACWGPFKK